ncbi:hypothetical protein [Streptomyces sp. NRRL S-1813]|uniref:hypothetical protein n=1 Tax=Streptomyces sp. NRRL S-1813 TaxID=1463888 RepID=UPI000AB4839D|nr:hypothetical protein [Streptomyces sp. NRRL S-1813]
MTALDHRLIRLKALPDGFQTECIETAERGQTGYGEDGVEHVEVFRMVDLDASPPTPRLHPQLRRAALSRYGVGDEMKKA